VKQQLREQYRTLDPVVLLAEIRAAQEELGNRIDCRVGKRRWQGCGAAAGASLSNGRNCFCEDAQQDGPGRRTTGVNCASRLTVSRTKDDNYRAAFIRPSARFVEFCGAKSPGASIHGFALISAAKP
jgi:hypothetical protein